MRNVFVALFLSFISSHLFAQNNVVVFSQNKCYFQHQDEMQEEFKAKSAPILNALVKEGKLVNWGVLTHAWGDEWNWNVYYVAEDFSKFHEAFGEYFSKLQEDPDLQEKFGKWCFEHKDSMYTQIIGYTAEADQED